MQKCLTKLTKDIFAYRKELNRRAISELMHAKLPAKLRDMIYAYLFPISEVRVQDAYMPSVRGTIHGVRFNLNDSRALILQSGIAQVKPAIFAAPFSPNVEILGDVVTEELGAYFYRTTTFILSTRPDLVDRCLYTPSFSYQLHKVSVTFRAALYSSGYCVNDIMQLCALEKLFELPRNVNISVIIDTGVGCYNRFLIMVTVAFTILDAFKEEGHVFSPLLEPAWSFEGRKEWVLKSVEQKETYVWTRNVTEG
jgi:hypothetical protein